MVRVQIKGGVWKNSEDEILKAAIMKYGLNQWSRVSTLLNRKTPKQCKARWYEWLDPSIKKTDWTLEEEEKLLHLAKILPTQWRTIAPMVGRTAAQCLEHYESLLNAAGKDELAEDDPKKLRPGEIDPLPEAKPARPDAVDMEEDEKEMLQEARARLANTKGKKAKRKAREKKLEEARRLASLQKMRELKAAGIEIEKKRKRKGQVNYLTEVPFEKVPQAGFFDVGEEKRDTVRQASDTRQFIGADIRDLDGKSKMEKEMEERKKDLRKEKLHRETNLPDHLMKLQKLNDAQQYKRRNDLNMPAPQLTERELEEMVKMDPSAFAAGVMGPPSGLPKKQGASAGGGVNATRTPSNRDSIMLEAQNLILLNASQTPLKGGENSVLHPTDFRSATPGRAVAMTPNVLVAQTPNLAAGRTPMIGNKRVASGMTPAMTPIRDEMSINDAQGLFVEGGSGMRQERNRQFQQRKKLKTGLSSIPAPINEYGLVMPDLPVDRVLEQLMSQSKKAKEMDEEDAEDLAHRMKESEVAEREAEIKRMPLALQKDLPRPFIVNSSRKRNTSTITIAQEYIDQEVLALLRRDAVEYPLGARKRVRTVASGHSFSDEELFNAKEMIATEVKRTAHDIPFELDSYVQMIQRSIGYIPARKHYDWLPTASHAEQEASLKQEWEWLRGQHEEAVGGADKLTQQITLLHGGYIARSSKLTSELSDMHQQLTETTKNMLCFTKLQDKETSVIPQRQASLAHEINVLKDQEHQLQKKYKKLQDELERMLVAHVAKA